MVAFSLCMCIHKNYTMTTQNKEREDILVSARCKIFVKKLKKSSGHSKGTLYEYAIWKTFGDEYKHLEEKKRKLIKQVNEIDARMKDIEEERKKDNFKPVEIFPTN